MKYIFIFSLVIGLWGQFNKIAYTNQLKADAATAFENKNYVEAAKIYKQLLLEYQLNDEKIRLNLANSFFLANDRAKAVVEYQVLTNFVNYETRSIAFQQLGMISAQRGKYDLALSHFKQALKTNDKNENARYNYELIKKIRDQEIDLQQQSQQNKKDNSGDKNKKSYKSGGESQQETTTKQLSKSGTQETKINQNTQGGNISSEDLDGDKESQSKQDRKNNKEDKELEEDKKGNKDKESLKIRRLKEINMSEEKARMILEMMKNEEIQYIQHMKKHEPSNNNKDKPDW
jgi:Ca-activated chloride channel family protein